MKLLLATVASLALLAGSANAAQLVLGTGVSGQTGASAGSQSGSGTFTLGGGFAATAQNNNTQSVGTTGINANAGVLNSNLQGTSAAATNSTSSGAGFSLGFAGSAGGAAGAGSASGGSSGFGGFGLVLP
jgi:hypothetical protein